MEHGPYITERTQKAVVYEVMISMGCRGKGKGGGCRKEEVANKHL
jgi:hypothetical protein